MKNLKVSIHKKPLLHYDDLFVLSNEKFESIEDLYIPQLDYPCRIAASALNYNLTESVDILTAINWYITDLPNFITRYKKLFIYYRGEFHESYQPVNTIASEFKYITKVQYIYSEPCPPEYIQDDAMFYLFDIRYKKYIQ